jgi:hypothetical protein
MHLVDLIANPGVALWGSDLREVEKLPLISSPERFRHFDSALPT